MFHKTRINKVALFGLLVLPHNFVNKMITKKHKTNGRICFYYLVIWNIHDLECLGRPIEYWMSIAVMYNITAPSNDKIDKWLNEE